MRGDATSPYLLPGFFPGGGGGVGGGDSRDGAGRRPGSQGHGAESQGARGVQRQDYDTARTLKQALEVCNTSGLDNHPIKARTHIHFGVVAIVGFKQRDAIKHFKKAIEIEPEIKLTKSLVTPQLQDAFEEAALTGDSPAVAQRPAEGRGDRGAAEGGEEKPSVSRRRRRRGRPCPHPGARRRRRARSR